MQNKVKQFSLNQYLRNIFFNMHYFKSKISLRVNCHNQLIYILNFHKVEKNFFQSGYPGIDTTIFRALINWLDNHFEIIDIDAIDNFNDSKYPKLIISFDDGYKSFITDALPVLKEYGIRANQNIIPGCINSGLPPMSVHLQDIFGQLTFKEIKNISPLKDINFLQNSIKNFSLSFATFFKKQSFESQKKIYQDILEHIPSKEYLVTEMMTIDDINDSKEYVDYGIHSFNHASMTYNSMNYFIDDLDKCKSWFSNNVDAPLEIYAFPNGYYKKKHIDYLVRDGFRHILLVDEDSYKTGISKPRFTMYGSSVNELIYRFL